MEINRMSSLQQFKPTTQVKPQVDNVAADSVQLGSNKGVDEGVPKKWLFMNYIGADCNLKQFQEANIDNQELVGSDANTHIVAMIDVGPESNPLSGEWTGCKTFYVTKDTTPNKVNSPIVTNHGDHMDMSDPKTLTNFIVDTMKKFPAENVALVLNDHGGGFTGAMADDSDGGFMSTPQLGKALADAEKITGKKIDIVGFDACLMANTEVAHALKDNAKILLAAEESEGGPGWMYDGMLNKGGGMSAAIDGLQQAMEQKITVSPEQFAKIVVKENEAHQRDIPTFSATDLTKIDALTQATDKLAKAMIDSNEKPALKSAMAKGDKYGGGYQPYGSLRDLDNLANNFIKDVNDPKVKEAAEGVKQAFADAIIANEANPKKYPNSKGLTIYAPTNAGSGVGYKYGDLAFAKETKWDEALTAVGKAGPKSEEVEVRAPEMPNVWPDGSPRHA